MSKSWRNIIISTLVAIVVYFFLLYSETRELLGINDQWLGLSIAIIIVILIGQSLMKLNGIYNKYLPWNKNISLRFSIEVATSIILSGAGAIIFIISYALNNYDNVEVPFLEFIYDGIIKFAILAVVISYIYSLINFSIYSYNQYSVGQIEALASERIQLDLSFEALKSQLNPHFLFNALNTISSLIFINIKQAENYIRMLADTYNYILDTNGDKVVSIGQEIEMTKAYFFMHKIRYEELVELDISDGIEKLEGTIPPFTLQILVENALKHSVISENNHLKIEIYCNNNNQIVVKNNIVEKPIYQSTMENLLNKQKDTESYKIGLSNISDRYKYLVNKGIEVTSGKYFKVKVPIIHNGYEK